MLQPFVGPVSKLVLLRGGYLQQFDSSWKDMSSDV